MIRELTLLFSVRVHGNRSLPGTSTFQHDMDETRLNSFAPTCSFFFYFTGSYMKHGGKMHL